MNIPIQIGMFNRKMTRKTVLKAEITAQVPPIASHANQVFFHIA